MSWWKLTSGQLTSLGANRITALLSLPGKKPALRLSWRGYESGWRDAIAETLYFVFENQIRHTIKLGNVWVFVQLISGPCWFTNQLFTNPNIANVICLPLYTYISIIGQSLKLHPTMYDVCNLWYVCWVDMSISHWSVWKACIGKHLFLCSQGEGRVWSCSWMKLQDIPFKRVSKRWNIQERKMRSFILQRGSFRKLVLFSVRWNVEIPCDKWSGSTTRAHPFLPFRIKWVSFAPMNKRNTGRPMSSKTWVGLT